MSSVTKRIDPAVSSPSDDTDADADGVSSCNGDCDVDDGEELLRALCANAGDWFCED